MTSWAGNESSAFTYLQDSSIYCLTSVLTKWVHQNTWLHQYTPWSSSDYTNIHHGPPCRTAGPPPKLYEVRNLTGKSNCQKRCAYIFSTFVVQQLNLDNKVTNSSSMVFCDAWLGFKKYIPVYTIYILGYFLKKTSKTCLVDKLHPLTPS